MNEPSLSSKDVVERLEHMAEFLMGASPDACRRLLLDAKAEIEQQRTELSVTQKLYAESCQKDYDIGAARLEIGGLKNKLRVMAALTDRRNAQELIDTPETPGSPTPHHVRYDFLGWLCSVCGGFNDGTSRGCRWPHTAAQLQQETVVSPAEVALRDLAFHAESVCSAEAPSDMQRELTQMSIARAYKVLGVQTVADVEQLQAKAGESGEQK